MEGLNGDAITSSPERKMVVRDKVNNDSGHDINKQNSIALKNLNTARQVQRKTSNPENLFDNFTWLIRDQTPNSLAQCILGHPFELG